MSCVNKTTVTIQKVRNNFLAQSSAEQEPYQTQADELSFPQVSHCGRYSSYQCFPVFLIELLMLNQAYNKIGVAFTHTHTQLSSGKFMFDKE